VAYRTDIGTRDKGGAVIAVIAVHAALLLALLNLSGKMDLGPAESALSVFNLTNPPPPPPPPLQQRRQVKPKEKAAASSPKNIKSQATPVVAPKPKLVTPPVQKIVASATPRTGAAATQGASNVVGPGTGAGGMGNGTGNGSGGNGTGGGGADVAEPPHLVTPVLSRREIPHDLLDQWPRGVPVLLRLRVDTRGYVIGCDVLRGTGTSAIDVSMCNIAHDWLRFRPALNRNGQPVAAWVGYGQPPPR
jgi:protein TonB